MQKKHGGRTSSHITAELHLIAKDLSLDSTSVHHILLTKKRAKAVGSECDNAEHTLSGLNYFR